MGHKRQIYVKLIMDTLDCNPSQVSATTIGYILEGQSTKRSGQATDKIGRIEPHHQGEKTEMVGACTTHRR